MKLTLRKFGRYPFPLRDSNALLLGSLALLTLQPLQAQQAMPPTAADQEANKPLPDPFSLALERLSKKYDVAFVAEGRPFAQRSTQAAAAPAAGGTGQEENAPQEEGQEPAKGASQEDEVRSVAERFDYEAVRQGNVYLLTKRYTNPDDIPEVTAEECRDALPHIIPNSYYSSANLQDQSISSGVNYSLRAAAVSQHRLTSGALFLGYTHSTSPKWDLCHLVHGFYFESLYKHVEATKMLLEHSRPLDPVFHWQTIGNTSIFGYDDQFRESDTQIFLPAGDTDRIQVVSYGTPLPNAGYVMRYEMNLPDPDPTDPNTLSKATRRFLDDHGRSSRAITLAEALAALNKRITDKTDKKIYKVDPIYASKRVTLVGVDALAPETLMQALGAVYGLGVDHRRDNTVVLRYTTGPLYATAPNIFTYFRQFDQYVPPLIPAPIYRAVHARFQSVRTRTSSQVAPQSLEYEAQYEFQRIADAYRYAAMQQFRYLAEPQVKAQPKKQLALSKLGERAQTLLTFAQTISTYAAACRFAEIPLPPYVTHMDDFLANVEITGGIYPTGGSPLGPYVNDPLYFSRVQLVNGRYVAPDNSARVAVFVTYIDPKSGEARGPVQILDEPLGMP